MYEYIPSKSPSKLQFSYTAYLTHVTVSISMSAAYAKWSEEQFTIEATTKYLHKSEDFIRRWERCYQQEESVDDLPRHDQSGTTKTGQEKVISSLFKKKLQLTIHLG